MNHVLDQGAIWTDKNGNQHPIKDMSSKYAANAYNLLIRNADAVASKYVDYLSRLPMPDPGSEAYDQVSESALGRAELIGADAHSWLRGTELMQALKRRATDSAEPKSPELNELVDLLGVLRIDEAPEVLLPRFEVAPRVEHDDRWQEQPDDDRRVFLVSRDGNDDYQPQAVFVGNRRAAHQYAAQLGRYPGFGGCYAEDVKVEAWDDNSCYGDAQVRKYAPAYVQATFVASVDTNSGRVFNQLVLTDVKQHEHPTVDTAKEKFDRRSTVVQVTTTGPDYAIKDIRLAHLRAIDEVRAVALEGNQ